jgi:hypothetical protein
VVPNLLKKNLSMSSGSAGLVARGLVGVEAVELVRVRNPLFWHFLEPIVESLQLKRLHGKCGKVLVLQNPVIY